MRAPLRQVGDEPVEVRGQGRGLLRGHPQPPQVQQRVPGSRVHLLGDGRSMAAVCPDAAPPGVRMRRATRSKYCSVPPRTVRVRPRRTSPAFSSTARWWATLPLLVPSRVASWLTRGAVGAHRQQQPHPRRVAQRAQLVGRR